MISNYQSKPKMTCIEDEVVTQPNGMHGLQYPLFFFTENGFVRFGRHGVLHPRYIRRIQYDRYFMVIEFIVSSRVISVTESVPDGDVSYADRAQSIVNLCNLQLCEASWGEWGVCYERV